MTLGLKDMSRGMVGEMLLKFPSYKTLCDDSGTEEMTTMVDGVEITRNSLWCHVLGREWIDYVHRPKGCLP
jgi:hypothetical protein